MNRRRKGIIVFTLITAGSVASAIGGLTARRNWHRENPTGNPVFAQDPRAESTVKRPKKGYIAALYLTGELMSESKEYNHPWVMQTLDDITNDENCLAIMLYLDTPGGGVYEADEVYLALMKYKDAGKKVEVYMGPLAASGGYYIACAADSIWANRNTLTGSIGVIAGRSVDATSMLEKIGVKSETITAGRNKNMMGFDSPFTEEQRAIIQSVADEAYNQFTGIVSQGRNMPLDKVKELADGRVYTAHQAKEAGLIDSIGTWDEALEDLRKRIENESCKVITFRYERKESILDIVRGAAKGVKEPLSLVTQSNLMIRPAYLYR